MLNPIWLATFVTLIDTGHFTKTAEKLFMTQPGVSQHINKLEHACGIALLKRHKKSFELTEQGRMVYQYALQLAKNEQALFERLAFDNPKLGECSLACSGALALSIYPELLNLQYSCPSLVIKLKAAPNHQILNEITMGTIDLGLVTDMPSNSLYDVEMFGHEELCLVLPCGIDVVQDIGALICKLGLISHPDSAHYLVRYCANSSEESLRKLVIDDIPIAGFVNQISQILQPIAKGIGCTVLPKSAIECFLSQEQLSVFTPQQAVIETLYVVKKKHRMLPARYDVLMGVLGNIAAKANGDTAGENTH